MMFQFLPMTRKRELQWRWKPIPEFLIFLAEFSTEAFLFVRNGSGALHTLDELILSPLLKLDPR